LIFDAGTGIIALGRKLVADARASRRPIQVALFFSHTHHDHTQGFPFFMPTRFQTTDLYLFGPKSLNANVQQALSDAMLPPVFPITLDDLPCRRVVHNLDEGQVVCFDGEDDEPAVYWSEREAGKIPAGGVQVRVLHSYAHPQGVYVYRVDFEGRGLVFATDVESFAGGDGALIRFARGADLLIHDSQYTDQEYAHGDPPRQGWGHSTWRMAVDAANCAGVKQLALFHHEPEHDDEQLEEIEAEARRLRPATFLAREGMSVEL
jgi:ribonuclease BN (tRNA processing enzyme)